MNLNKTLITNKERLVLKIKNPKTDFPLTNLLNRILYASYYFGLFYLSWRLKHETEETFIHLLTLKFWFKVDMKF